MYRMQENLTLRFCTLFKMIRVIAYCRTFISNCRLQKMQRMFNMLELHSSLTCSVKMVQGMSYAQELQELRTHQEVFHKSSIISLHPFIDHESLIRVRGRLQQSSLSYGTVHQLILPPNHHLTELIVSAEHIRLLHAGPQLLTASQR